MLEKSIWQSKTFYGAFIALLSVILGLFGKELAPQDQEKLVEICLALAGIIGSLFAIYGRVAAVKPIQSKTGKPHLFMFCLTCALPVLILSQGCALSTMNGPERARTVGQEFALAYFDLHGTYLKLEQKLSTKDAQCLRDKVAPLMNKAKHSIVAFNDAAILYARLGEQPENLQPLAADIGQLLADIAQLLSNMSGHNSQRIQHQQLMRRFA